MSNIHNLQISGQSSPKIAGYPGDIAKPEDFFGVVAQWVLKEKEERLQNGGNFQNNNLSEPAAKPTNYSHVLNWLDKSKFGNKNDRFELRELFFLVEDRLAEEETRHEKLKQDEARIRAEQARDEQALRDYVLCKPFAQQKIEQEGGDAFREKAKTDPAAGMKMTKIFIETVASLSTEERTEYYKREKETDERYENLKEQLLDPNKQLSKADRSQLLINTIRNALDRVETFDFKKIDDPDSLIKELSNK